MVSYFVLVNDLINSIKPPPPPQQQQNNQRLCVINPI